MEDNASLMRRYYDGVYNRRNVEFLSQHLHPEVASNGPGIHDQVRGIEEVVAFSQYVYQVYRGYHLEVNGVVEQGDRVVIRGTVIATHIPTGRPCSFCGLTLYRLQDGLIREYWRCYDRHDFYDVQLDGWRPSR